MKRPQPHCAKLWPQKTESTSSVFGLCNPQQVISLASEALAGDDAEVVCAWESRDLDSQPQEAPKTYKKAKKLYEPYENHD